MDQFSDRHPYTAIELPISGFFQIVPTIEVLNIFLLENQQMDDHSLTLRFLGSPLLTDYGEMVYGQPSYDWVNGQFAPNNPVYDVIIDDPFIGGHWGHNNEVIELVVIDSDEEEDIPLIDLVSDSEESDDFEPLDEYETDDDL